MLTSLAYIFLLGILLGEVFSKLKLPALLGMLLTGVLLGPFALNLIDSALLWAANDLRQMALIIILLRAGLALRLEDLKKVGRPAALMCFVPACFEIAGCVLLAPLLLGLTYLEAALLGSVLAAVSPAVVVPRMLELMEKGYGTEKGIPQLVMASASVDDIFVIVLFTTFASLATGGGGSFFKVLEVPVSILLGAALGYLAGGAVSWCFQRIHVRDSAKVMIVLSVAFLFITLQQTIAEQIPFSGLLAVMAMGIGIMRFHPALSKRMSARFSKLWVAAQVLLFVLVGAAVDITHALDYGVRAVLLILAVLVFRAAGVLACLLRTDLDWRERLFCVVAYLPKATVQAAIGALPLAMGLPCGQVILAVAVLAILITAPLGAIGIDLLFQKCLKKQADWNGTVKVYKLDS